MAKKSASKRHSAARRPQSAASKQATLVRTPDTNGSNVATAEAETQTAVATMTEATPTAAKPAPKPQAQTKAVATRPTAKSAATRADAARVARAQATKNARAAHLISASNYGYVLHDLRLTGILAAIMLIVMIVLKIFMR